MSNISSAPIDWAWERAKAKAAIDKAVVLSEDEKKAHHQSIDADFDKRETDWRLAQLENTAVLPAIRATGQMVQEPVSSANGQEPNAMYTGGGLSAGDLANKPHTPPNATVELVTEVNADQELPRRSEGQETIQRVVVRAVDVQSNLPTVGTPLKLCIQAALIQLDPFKREVAQSNELRARDPEAHDKLIETLDRISEDLNDLYNAIPINVESVSTADAENVASYFDRYKNGALNQLETYLNPETLGEKTTTTTILVICGAVGAFFGGPLVGLAAGATLIGGKPQDLVKKIGSKLSSDRAKLPDTPDQ